MQPCSIPVGGINQMTTISKYIVQLTFQSLYNEFSKTLFFLTVPKIADAIPSEAFPRENVKIPRNLKLADPDFHLPRPVDLLIGSGPTLSLLSIGQINLSTADQEFYLQKTLLGWVAAGNALSIQGKGEVTCKLTNLESLIRKFWEIEELIELLPRTLEEVKCEQHFVENIRRDNTGRYIVRLPFRLNAETLGNSRSTALKRYLNLEQKLNKNPDLKVEYSKVMQEYIDLKHMVLVKNPRNEGFYLPHHAVIKETSETTKVRVVFDASAKSDTGVSLNDILMVGPTIQNKLFSHLVRFRFYEYVMTADIEKMYRQILVDERDCKYQRVLWRDGKEINTYELKTVTFGIASSAFTAIRTLYQIAEDERDRFPIASEIMKSHIYVDDLMTGSHSIDDALIIQNEIINLLKCGQFNIRQWASNDRRLIKDLAKENLNSRLLLDKDCELKTLGMSWNPRDDTMFYSVKPIKIELKVTKRNIFSEIAKIFDPLGYIGPVLLLVKRIMQDTWSCKLEWDESVPSAIYTAWLEFVTELNLLKEFTFKRCTLISNYKEVQIHGFSDASGHGYGACIYLRSINENDEVVCRLMCSKSRVAPLKGREKPLYMPRLELCGALLLAQLYHEVYEALNISHIKAVFWCDSAVALHWIRRSPMSLKMYVARRVAEIQEKTDSSRWRHVKSKDNPADALSRGQLPTVFLKNRLWFEGPSWLNDGEENWPRSEPEIREIPELNRNICLTTVLLNLDIFKKFSSWPKLVRIIAYCLRFRKANKYTGNMCVEELKDAEMGIIKIVQSVIFANEINIIRNKRECKTKFDNLCPFIDELGLLRVGGRLQKSSLAFAQKHPILLPNKHFITDLIIEDIHIKNKHAGIQTTLYISRNRFWITDGRNQVRKIVRDCVTCFRFRAESIEYRMGNLPQVRVNNARAFVNVGVDFCGPFFIKEKKFRNRSRVKVYVCVFICMVIKAVHLEVVSDLTTESFLAAFRRFIARRGVPTHVYSDNGTNFVGANNKLSELFDLFNKSSERDKIRRVALEKGLKWHFIPPLNPHYGGLWESTVKVFKHHFKRVVGELLFTYEELSTFVVEIEGILNSRPLTPISNDPNDILVLTPAHYLIGESLVALPERDFTDIPANRLSTWEHVVKIRQHFWSRWNQEYLNELQQRSKWTTNHKNLEVNTVVVIKDKNTPCRQWSLGRVVQVIPGNDGIVREALIKTSTGIIRRGVRLLCPLPLNERKG